MADLFTKAHVLICMVWVVQVFVAFGKAWVTVAKDETDLESGMETVVCLVAGLVLIGFCIIVMKLTYFWCRIANVAIWLSITMPYDVDIKTAAQCIKTSRFKCERIVTSDHDINSAYRRISLVVLAIILLLLPLRLTLPIVVKTFGFIEFFIAIAVLLVGLSLLYRTAKERWF